MESLKRIRFPLMAAALLAALAAMWAGLVRLGWGLPPLTPTLAMTHGPLMISGFLGTLINLERVVALNRRWAYAAPLATALGVLVLLLGVTGPIGPLMGVGLCRHTGQARMCHRSESHEPDVRDAYTNLRVGTDKLAPCKNRLCSTAWRSSS